MKYFRYGLAKGTQLPLIPLVKFIDSLTSILVYPVGFYAVLVQTASVIGLGQ